jgi:hypothetical protein
MAHWQLGDKEQARMCYSQAVQWMENNEELNQLDVDTRSDIYSLSDKSLLGGSLLSQKKYTEAEPLLLAGYEGMKQREQKMYAQDKFLLTEALERGVVQTWVARPESSKGVSAAAHALRRLRACHPETGLLEPGLERLVQLYEATGNKARADEWRKKLPVTKSATPAETKKD